MKWKQVLCLLTAVALLAGFTACDPEPDPIDLSALETYAGEWLDRDSAAFSEETDMECVSLTEVYADCFFGETLGSNPWTFKVNGTLTGEWCRGDHILLTYKNAYTDEAGKRMECELITAEKAPVDDKPVIYLYPETTTDVSVKLTLNGELTCTYPAYRDGWRVTASPDGTLTDVDGMVYNYLYWEGVSYAEWDYSRGFCVRGEDTAAFLEDALEQLGLNRREANEFIVYWLPRMEQNPYNIIAFQTDVYTESAKLDIVPAPDTLIRVFMTYYASDAPVEIEPQELTAPERTGFVAVEWGGSEG